MNVHNVDDVDMHEEEEQLIRDLGEQQQQEDENENLDEQADGEDAGVLGRAEGVGEGGEAHPQDEIIALEDDDWNDDLQSFERSCVGLEKNDPLHSFYMPPIDLDDNRSVLLGKALLGNTATTELAIEFEQQAGFTSRGARAIVGGIVGSQISSLSIDATEELPLEMSQLCTESISLHFPIGDEFTSQLCKYLTASTSLDHLSIQIDHMTPRGAQVLANFLRSSHLSSLEFCDRLGNAVTTSVMRMLLLEGVQHCQCIEELCLDGNVGDMHALATNILPKLQNMSLTKAHLSLSEVELLTQGLSDANQLCTLTLTKCRLSDGHMSVLSPILGTHPTLKSLVLSSNNIGDAGVASFVDHWRPTSMIEKLTLSSNKIGSKGAELLIRTLSNRLVLCSLDVSYHNLGFDGLRLIGEALPGAKIQMLSIFNLARWIKYEDAGCDAAVIQEAKRMAASKALLAGVRSNCHLLQLSHCFSNVLQAEDEKEIKLYTESNACGRGQALELQHSLPRAVWSHFFAKKGMTESLTFLFLRELPTLMTSCGSSSSNNNNIGRKRCRDF